jgi:hypothetical protein
MVYTLTNIEKSEIISQHLKALEYSKYNVEINLIEENAVPSGTEGIAADMQSQINKINLKIAALVSELDELA